MLLTRLFLSAMLLAGIASAVAQPPRADNRITVTGSGEIAVEPDMAVITVEAVNRAGSPRGALAGTRKDMNNILAAARKSVRDSVRDLRTTNVAVNPEYEWAEGKRRFRGYSASQALEVTIRDLALLEAVLEDLARAPVTTMGNLEFRHSKADSLRRAAEILALREAAVAARNLCGAVGRVCEDLLAARVGGAGPAPMPEMRMMRMAADAGATVQPGVLTFAAAVEADYRIEPKADAPKPAPRRDPKPEAKAEEPAPSAPEAGAGEGAEEKSP
jgi:uncharacterized protein